MLSNSSGQVVSALVSFKFSVFKRWKSWTVVTICCLASYVVLKEISNRHLILLPPHCFFRKNCSTWVNLLKKTKGCVADGIAKTQKYRLWNNLTRIVESCAEPLCPLRNLHYLINWGDVKGYMGNANA